MPFLISVKDFYYLLDLTHIIMNKFHPFQAKFLAFFLAFSPLTAAPLAVETSRTEVAESQLAQLEQTFGPRLGVCAIDTSDGSQIRYQADERFPFCSTFKVILAAAILERSREVPDLLRQRIDYTKNELVTYSPITEKHLTDGMTVADLCAAALQYSDNTASNLLIKILGGPMSVTAYARSIGNHEFRLDRWETELNTSLPDDPRDTVTPAAMAQSLLKLTTGDALSKTEQKQLNDWMRGNTTGAKRIRAGVPDDWIVGDKTGSGAYGVTNDIAVLWPPGRQPIVLAIYYRQEDPEAKWQDEIIAQATRIVREAFVPPTDESPSAQ